MLVCCITCVLYILYVWKKKKNLPVQQWLTAQGEETSKGLQDQRPCSQWMNILNREADTHTWGGGHTLYFCNVFFFFITKTVYFSPKESNTQKVVSWSHHCLIRAKVAAQNRDQILHINAESVSDANSLDSVYLNTLPGYSWEKLFKRLWEGKCIPQKANYQKKTKKLHGPRVLLTIWVKAVVLLLWSEARKKFSAASQPRCCEARAEGFFFFFALQQGCVGREGSQRVNRQALPLPCVIHPTERSEAAGEDTMFW